MKYRVLVLGAGASKSYGYPLGNELRERILAVRRSSIFDADSPYKKEHQEQLDEFRESFRLSDMYSIDAFLGRRPEFSSIGKKCIASVLLQCERPELLYPQQSDADHWYKYLFSRISRRVWEELSFDDIAIVSFNYDRSLQHYLYSTLKSTYKKTGEEVRDKLRELRIVNVYGCLSEGLPEEEGCLAYDGITNPAKVDAAASGLIVIPEGREDSPTLNKARDWLSGAHSIGFMGFGYDETNVARLAVDGACRGMKLMPGGHTLRTICGTRIGMYDAEIQRAIGVMSDDGYIRLESFHPKGCTDFLRITQILG